MKKKVSIIIPVYNVEKYLKECMDSVINQTLKEIEIICINDGSTDNSPKILEDYAQKDERIKIINKKNNGLGAARNTGIEYATGEYIGFVDSDDWINITMYEKLYNNAKSQNSDIVMCPVHRFDDITKELLCDDPYFTLKCFDKTFDDYIFDYTKTKEFLFSINVTAWNKIYRTEFLHEINAKFPENLSFEDTPFFYETYLKAKNMSLIRDFLYFYRMNRDGSLIAKGGKNFFDIIKIHDLIFEIFIEANCFEEYKTDLLNKFIASYFYRYDQVEDVYKKEFFELIKKDFKKKNLKTDEIDKLNDYTKNKYQNVITSESYTEFELLDEIYGLKVYNNRLLHEKQVYEDKIKEIMSSNTWRLTKPFRKLGIKLRYIKKGLHLQ